MRYTIQDIWEQALLDSFAMEINSTSTHVKIIYGCRIVKDKSTDKISLFNAGGGDYYIEMNEEEVEIFLENGWRHGCYTVSLSNCKRKLLKVEKRIRDEMNSKKNPKQISSYKESRETILSMYTRISNKLNKIK